MMIPAEEIRKDGDQRFVYVANAGAAQKREVAAGQRSGAWIEIKKGLDAGDGVYLRDLPAAGGKK